MDDLFGRLTQDEKLSLLTGTGFATPAIPRLGVPAMEMCDGPKGVRGGDPANTGPATLFLEPMAMAATWDPAAIYRVGVSLGEEAANKGIGARILLGPCINIMRSPLGGRSGEGFGEDPYLVSRMAVAYIRGVQSTGVAACVKHYAVNNEEGDRMTVDARVDERTLREIYLPGFQASVEEGHAWAIMAAYNQINGHYATANHYLLTEILRHQWGFDGVAMSDWGAVHETDGVVNAGLDLEMPGGAYLTVQKLQASLAAGRITQDSIDIAVHHILRTIIRVGLLDGPMHPDHTVVNEPSHRKANFDAATEAMVLLKNDHGVLPLDRKRIRTIAVLGPTADSVWKGIGGSSSLDPIRFVTPLDAIRASAGKSVNVIYAACPGIGGQGTFGQSIDTSFLTPSQGQPGEHGLTGEYFANDHLGGDPALVRNDPVMDMNWDTTSPAPSIPRTYFSARWTGTLTPPATGHYIFGFNADDGCRLIIDGVAVIDYWQQQDNSTPRTGSIDLVAGRAYPLTIEYYQVLGAANIHLGWVQPGGLQSSVSDSVAAARQADVALVFVGGSFDEGEGHDRASMDLYGGQDALINAVAAVNKNTVVIVSSGGPCLLAGWIGQVRGVLQAWNAGQEAGDAVAAILFGDVNPSGKLPCTFAVRREDYADYGHFPGVNGVSDYKEGIFVGYRHFDSAHIAPLFPFGYGLSYTTFRYGGLKVSPAAISAAGTVNVTLTVKNTGKREGREVVELYIHDPHPLVEKAVRELKRFAKVDLDPGSARTVAFQLTPRDFTYFDTVHERWHADQGIYNIDIGASSRDIRLQGSVALRADYNADPGAPVQQ